MDKPRAYTISLATVYPLYLAKVAKKGRSEAELEQVICWLTGYDAAGLKAQLASNVDLEGFFTAAPALNPNASLITGTICGQRLEDIEDKLLQQIRWLDKLVDELAKGKAIEKILRA